MTRLAHYRYDLGDGLFLDAFAINPSLTPSSLEALVRSKDWTSKFNLEALSRQIIFAGKIASLSEFKLEVSSQHYQVPPALMPYREALEKKLEEDARLIKEGKLQGQPKRNNPIPVVMGSLQIPVRVCAGRYFDFMATQLEAIPASLVPGIYAPGKTLEQLMPELRITNEDRARQFGFAYLVQPNNGKEVNFVQRAADLAIAPGCISISGSTPPFDQRFFEPGFNFPEFYKGSIVKHMKDEYGLEQGEFSINELYLVDDKRTIPHIGIRILTPMPMAELAERGSRSAHALKEHPVLYNMPIEAVRTFLDRFEMWPAVSVIMHHFYNDEMSKRKDKL